MTRQVKQNPVRYSFLMSWMALILVASIVGCASSSNPVASCEGVTCGGHGQCELQDGLAICVCETGYIGDRCHLCDSAYHFDGIDACVQDEICPAVDICGDHGTCADTGGVVACTCDTGYEGELCDQCAFAYIENAAGECVLAENCPGADICGDHGTCDDSSGVVVCVCETGYSGVQCVDCAEGYHLFEGACVEDETCPATDPCGPHSSCDDTSGIVICVCDNGYHSDGQGNCLENQVCPDPDPCGEHGTCDNSSGSIECICDTGYRGVWCNACAAGYHPGPLGDCLEDEFCPDPDPCGQHGSCDDTGGEVVCICETGYDGEFCADCAFGYVPQGDLCVEINDCHDYLFEEASYIYELALNDGGEEPCCFDYTGDGEPDSAFGAMVHSLAGLVGMDFNQVLQDRLVEGEICQLLEYHGLTDLQDNDSFSLPIFSGQDTDADYDNNLIGDEQFNVLESSFIHDQSECTAEPLELFEASLTGGELNATAASYGGLSMPVFPDTDPTDFVLQDVRLSADLVMGTHGIEAQNGKLGGVFKLDGYLTALNEMYADQCQCLGIDGPLMSWQIVDDQFEVTCQETPDSTCSDGDPEVCSMTDTTCAIMPVFLLSTDVDTDGDSINDAFSVGFEFEATSGEITAVIP
jgi:EGF domain-containing protein